MLVGVAYPFHHGRAVLAHTRDLLGGRGCTAKGDGSLGGSSPYQPPIFPTRPLAPFALASAPPHCYTVLFVLAAVVATLGAVLIQRVKGVR